MKAKTILLATMAALVLSSCGGSAGKSEGGVDVSQTQKPTMFVLPSDQLLQRFGNLKQQEALGKTLQVRDYPGYMLSDQDSKFIISTIQSKFIEFGYPLNDL